MTINAQGIIQMANKVAAQLLGYKKGELEGKNVSCIMPQPFSSRHNGYLRNYIATGKAKILDSVREVVALHKERYVFPLRLVVTKVSGAGQDSLFMGVLRVGHLPGRVGLSPALQRLHRLGQLRGRQPVRLARC
jgi:PAS domain S-box-containing protein